MLQLKLSTARQSIYTNLYYFHFCGGWGRGGVVNKYKIKDNYQLVMQVCFSPRIRTCFMNLDSLTFC